MQAREGVLDFLNRHLTVELTAINQYFLQAEMAKNWGFERIYEKLRELSLEEMKDAEALVGHILFLEGLPNMQRLSQVQVGETIEECFRIDLATEMTAVSGLTEAIAHCTTVGDYKTRAMLEEMIAEEQEHVDYFETQMEAISRVGIENYLAQQLH
ncbi:MAG: bacterioferritin [Tepidiformaceae bacterium]